MARRFDFETLERLRSKLITIRRSHVSTMTHYVNDPNKDGFWHVAALRHKAALSSTSTCVSSLVAANLWGDKDFPLRERAPQVAAKLLSRRESAGLYPNNAFSIAFVAEGVLALAPFYPTGVAPADHERQVQSIIAPKLVEYLQTGNGTGEVPEEDKKDWSGDWKPQPGSISIYPYPASSYLTQLVFRVLRKCKQDSSPYKLKVNEWARIEINKQISLITAGSRVSDPLQLAYALILAADTLPDEGPTPEDKEIFRHGLTIFFEKQNIDGGWPVSRPLFHYPTIGNAYCFDYELLAQLLACTQLWDHLLGFMDKLERSTDFLAKTAYDLRPTNPDTVVGWASGHHPQLEGPESWSTASVYQFAFALDRLVAEGIRRTVFEELAAIYRPPQGVDADPNRFAADMLDSDLWYRGEKLSLKKSLFDRFVKPITSNCELVAKGGKLPKHTPMSAILFGPPGTSKTQLAKIISDYIGWPLVSVDPSYLVSEGLDRIQAMANRLFSMLEASEQIVVLLDEFDELGRDRTQSNEILSRFITTAMLPKLAEINKERKIVFLLATNYVSGFDAAFSRGGRFDMLIQVMPPTFAEKLRKWPVLEESIDKCDLGDRPRLTAAIEDLTFDETSALALKLPALTDATKIAGAISEAQQFSTLQRTNVVGRDQVGDTLSLLSPNEMLKLAASLGAGFSWASLRNTAKRILEGRAEAKPNTWKATCIAEREQIRIPGM